MKKLRIAGIISFIIALFQAVISFSPSWSLFFGAPTYIASNPMILLISGLITTVIFVLFGIYGISGSGIIRPLPMLRWSLLVIGGIYSLRGLLLILQLLIYFGIVNSDKIITPQLLLSSVISLIIGCLYLIGTIDRWEDLKPISNRLTNASS